MQNKFATMGNKFTQWSEHSTGIVQILTWIDLESVGFGASLQHNNHLTDQAVKKEWNISEY